MTLVERFIDFSDWTTSRKTMYAATTAYIAQLAGLAVGSFLLLLRPVAVDLSMLSEITLGGALLNVGIAAISWFVYKRGSAGRWTGYLLMITFSVWVVAFVVAQGVFATPFMAFPLLMVLFTALWFDVQLGVASLACYGSLLVTAGVLTLAGVIPFAPTMESRDLDSMNSVGWFLIAFFMLSVVAVATYLLGFVAVAAASLQRRRLVLAHGLIRRYVPEQVADAVLSETPETVDRHERRKLTIFFSDLVGFTDLSEELEPEDLAMVLHDYFTEMSAVAKRHGGTVDDLVGDAILILFGAPERTDDKDQALRAVHMAVEMQEAMGPLNERWSSAGIPETLTVRMGINTGVATVGNFGSAERTKYTALGKQVNVAARIQSQCEPGKVLIGHTTWLLVRDEILCTPKGELELKGLHKPMPAYEVEA